MANRRPYQLLAALSLSCLLGACQEQQPPPPTSSLPTAEEHRPTPAPPTPPLFESFEDIPQLDLFPRLGDYRPEVDDAERLKFWYAFREHLSKASGVATAAQGDNRIFILRTIRSLDAVGFFSPVATRPGSSYRVSYKVKAELPEGATTGIGIIEYSQFLWEGEQYPESLDSKYRVAASEGLRLAGAFDWQKAAFEFTAGATTKMVHLVFFREGTTDRSAVLIDDIAIEPI